MGKNQGASSSRTSHKGIEILSMRILPLPARLPIAILIYPTSIQTAHRLNVSSFFPRSECSVWRGARLGGQYQPTARAGTAATQAAINSITDPTTFRDNYMNPFTDDVIDMAIDDLRDERDMMNETIRLRNPYGGASRAALLEAQNNANYLDLSRKCRRVRGPTRSITHRSSDKQLQASLWGQGVNLLTKQLQT